MLVLGGLANAVAIAAVSAGGVPFDNTGHPQIGNGRVILIGSFLLV